MGWTVCDSRRREGEIFWNRPNVVYDGNRLPLLRVKRPERVTDPYPLLVPRSSMITAVFLHPLCTYVACKGTALTGNLNIAMYKLFFCRIYFSLMNILFH